MNTLDDLFKEKLRDFPVTPSPGSWQKVEASLAKKNNSIAWRWAAVFLIAALAGTLWLVKGTPPATVLAQKETSIKKTVPEIQQPETSLSKEATTRISVARKRQTPDPVAKEKAEVLAPKKIEDVQPIVEKAIAHDAQSVVEEVEVPVAAQAASQSIVLTYTLGPVETKSLGDDLVVSDKRDYSLKRVVDFAKNVKNSDSPIGGLRVMKEDLFALDLKKKTTSKNH